MKPIWTLIAASLAVILFAALWTLISFSIFVVFSSGSADEMVRNIVVVFAGWTIGPGLAGFLAPLAGSKIVPKANARAAATVFLLTLAFVFSALIISHGWLHSEGLSTSDDPGHQRMFMGIQMFCALLGGWLARLKLKPQV